MPTVTHTFVLSDVHLTTVEAPDPERPLWKRYKQADLVIDDELAAAIAHMSAEAGDAAAELVLNGDIFDFDSVMDQPDDDELSLSWLERLRGMNSSEPKSTLKLCCILDDHPIFVDALREWLARPQHSVVFVIGNHDLELHWPAVQAVLRARLGLEPADERLRVCAWFYLSEGDTHIEHGNQYDSYCLCLDPLWPLVRVRRELRVRMPFGNLAGRIMLNGMGLFNPHVESTFILPFTGYVVFFFKHVIRTNPMLPWSWLWSAGATFVVSMRDGLLPSVRDPLRLDDRVDAVAAEAKATPRMVRALEALRVHAAIFNPFKVARELWLDRVLMLALVVFGSFQAIATLQVFTGLSAVWWFAALAALLPFVIFWAGKQESDVNNVEAAVLRRLALIRQITGVRRVVLGHTHIERHTWVEGVELLNPGTWSPAFSDVACTQRVGRACYVHLRPKDDGGRDASVKVWVKGDVEALPFSDPPKPRLRVPLFDAPAR